MPASVKARIPLFDGNQIPGSSVTNQKCSSFAARKRTGPPRQQEEMGASSIAPMRRAVSRSSSGRTADQKSRSTRTPHWPKRHAYPMRLLTTIGDGWHPGIGDPTVMGWLTVVAYLGATYSCYRAFRASRLSGPDEERAPMRALWLGLTVLMGFLAINKQLDLQSLMTEVGRNLAHEQGWYERRGEVQRAFIGTIGLLAVVCSVFLLRLARGPLARARLALVGACGLLAFIVIRAASFHHVDILLKDTIFGIRVNWALELGAIGCIFVSARRNAVQRHRSAPRRAPS